MKMADADIDLSQPSLGQTIVKTFCNELNRFEDRPAKAYLSRADAVGANEWPALLVYADTEDLQLESGEAMKRTRKIVVEILTGTDGESTGEVTQPTDAPLITDVLDRLYVYVVLAVATSQPIADLVASILESRLQWDLDSGFTEYGKLGVEFEVEFVTQVGNPTKRV